MDRVFEFQAYNKDADLPRRHLHIYAAGADEDAAREFVEKTMEPGYRLCRGGRATGQTSY